jgi:hypothetical protein
MIRVEKAQWGQRLEDVCASSCLLNQRFRTLVVPERLPPDLSRCGSGRGPGRGGHAVFARVCTESCVRSLAWV